MQTIKLPGGVSVDLDGTSFVAATANKPTTIAALLSEAERLERLARRLRAVAGSVSHSSK